MALAVTVVAVGSLVALPVLGQEANPPGQSGGGGPNALSGEHDAIKEQLEQQHGEVVGGLQDLDAALAVDAEPVLLQFAPSNSNGWDDEAEYLVPEGKKLRVEFVGFRMSLTSIGSGNLHTNVELQVNFPNGEGGFCNQPTDDGDCTLNVPVIPLNNTEFGANVSFQHPTTGAPVALEAPAGATISARLGSGLANFGGPGEDTLRVINVTFAGQLIDVP